MTAMAKRQTPTYDLSDPAIQGLSAAVPLTFESDPKGSVSSRHSGYPVYVDRSSTMEINPGDTFFVRLKDKTVESGCFFAVPVKPVDAGFFVELCTDDKMAFLRSVFMAGGKPSEALIDAIVESSPEICDSLQRSSDVLQKNIDSSNAAVMYKTKLDNANETIRKKNDEIAKLRGQISAKASDGEVRKEDLKALRNTVSEQEQRIAELNGALSVSKGEVESLRNELELSKEAVVTAQRERDEALERSEAQPQMSQEVDELVSKLSERDRLIGSLGERIADLTKANSVAHSCVPAYETVFRPAVTVRRDSGITLSSDWFTHARYRVMMSGDMAKLLIRPDDDGEVVCEGYSLRIPRLATIKPFVRTSYLEAEFSPDMGSVEVVL